jgi:ATP-binding cassette subfamily F protein 3
MMICAADKISKNWGLSPVLHELSIEIGEKERVGLVGPNGCGKTTLLSLLAGMDTPDTGSIYYKKGLRVAAFAQIPEFGPNKTAGDVLNCSECGAACPSWNRRWRILPRRIVR